MEVYVALFFHALICFNAIAATQDTNGDTLVLLHVVYRHGDRTPIRTFKNDPIPITAWKEGPGELTKTGCMQHYTLGKSLREHYKDFITGNPHEVLVWSSNRNRCLASASCHLAGMYAPPPDWVWNKDLHWQPVPIHTRPIYEDGMLVPGESLCPAAEAEAERFKNSQEAQEFLHKYHKLYEYLTEKTGSVIPDWNEAAFVYDVLLIEKLHNYTLPNWTESVWNDLQFQSDQSFVFYTPTPLLRKLRAGLLLANITKGMEAAARNESLNNVKLFMYSTHDTEVSALLDALRVFDGKAPPYCSTLLLELWRDPSGSHSVRGFTLSAFDHNPKPVTFPGCSSVACPLEQFLSLARPSIPKDWRKECGLVPLFFLSDGALALVVGQSALLAILAFSITAYCLLHRRKVPKGSIVYSPLPTEFTTN